MDPVITLDLRSAEELQALPEIMRNDALRESLADAIFRAEMGDICNDVFLFEYPYAFEFVCMKNSINFVRNG